MRHDENYVDPNREQFEQFKNLDRNQPILMLNMLRFRAEADYPTDHPRASDALTGEQAYAHYGEESGPIFQRQGGKIVWRGNFQTTLIGPADESWDTVFIARYPTAHAFLGMITDPDYQQAVVNRQAAVATSRLIRLSEATLGTGFG